MMLRVLFSVPLIGWMIRDAVRGSDESRAWFLANIALLWIWSGVLFGYPGVIIPALAAAGVMLATLVAMTAEGLVRRG